MKKIDFMEKLMYKYMTNASLEADILEQTDREFYYEAVKKHGSWQKALKANGLTKKKLTERKKFFLYCLMKQRYEKYGEEALRPKNIDNATKDRIVEVYKTIKNLNRILKIWDAEKALYELRIELITGGTLKEVSETNPELTEKLFMFFDSMEAVETEYKSRFGLKSMRKSSEIANIEPVSSPVLEKPILVAAGRDEETKVVRFETAGTPSKGEEVPVPVEVSPAAAQEDNQDIKLLQMLKKLNYLKDEELTHIMQAGDITKDEILSYLMEQMAVSRKSNVKLTEEYIQNNNASMYYAIKAEFGSLKNSVDALTKEMFRIV